MKEKAILVIAGLCLLIGFALFLYDREQPHFRPIEHYKPTMRPVTITGEVVDAWCYASQTMGPGKGISHRACALACVNGGVSVGILENKTNYLYVAAKYKGFRGCKDLLLPYVGDKVTVTGWVGEKGGCRMLRIETVKRISGPDDILLQELKPENTKGQASEPTSVPAVQSKSTSEQESRHKATRKEPTPSTK